MTEITNEMKTYGLFVEFVDGVAIYLQTQASNSLNAIKILVDDLKIRKGADDVKSISVDTH